MIDKEAFLKAALPEKKVNLHGAEVTVRGLSRSEVVGLQAHKDSLPKLEMAILALGFVDPALDADDVKAWYESAPAGDIDKVVGVISDLSGMTPASSKSGVPGVRRGPRA